MKNIIWWATCAIAWIGRWLCKHPSPYWEGNGLTLMGHHEAQAEAFWRCLKCGKRYTTRGHYKGKAAQVENVFMQGAEAFLQGKTLFDNPHGGAYQGREGNENAEAWRRGFQSESRRFNRDPK